MAVISKGRVWRPLRCYDGYTCMLRTNMLVVMPTVVGLSPPEGLMARLERWAKDKYSVLIATRVFRGPLRFCGGYRGRLGTTKVILRPLG